jgi:hypothetical protein
MSTTPKTIQIYLPGGDPRGIRVAEVTTRIVQVIEVPRSLLGDFLKMPESAQVAVYFLVAEAVEENAPKVYVGQTGDLRNRLAQHNAKKDFWQRALVLVSKTNSLTQTHALFLEWYCLQAIQKAGRYAGENGTAGTKPHTPAPMEADCLEVFDTGSTLIATLGHPLFEPVASTPTATTKVEVFTCTASGTNARGQYTPEGFVVLAGSVGRRANVPSIVGKSDERFREKLIAAGAMRVDGERVVFDRDHLFGSPTMAAIAVLGRTANGWLEWKAADGRTLDEVVRVPMGKGE